MIFHSYEFVVFLVIILGVCYLARQTIIRNVFLLIGSYIFYSWGDPSLLFFIVFSSILDYLIGFRISNADSAIRKKIYLIVSLVANLGLLATLKYATWFIDLLGTALGYGNIPWEKPDIDLPLPLGISFYTFQTIGYTIDIYRGHYKPHRNGAALVIAFNPITCEPSKATEIRPTN